MTYNHLREKLERINDPGFDKPFKDVAGIKKLTIGSTGVVECESYLKGKKSFSYIGIDSGKVRLGAQQIGYDVLGVIENMSYLKLENQENPLYLFGQGGGKKMSKTLIVPLFGSIPIGQTNQRFIHQDGHIYGAYPSIAKKLMEHSHE